MKSNKTVSCETRGRRGLISDPASLWLVSSKGQPLVGSLKCHLSLRAPGPTDAPPLLTSRARPRRDGSICVKLSPPRKMLTGKSYRALPRLYQSTSLFSPQSGPHYVCSGSKTESQIHAHNHTTTHLKSKCS